MAERTKTITHGAYLQLLGLAVLGSRHVLQLRELEHAAAAIVGESDDNSGGAPYYGHVSDMLYTGDPSVSDMLRRLEITVEEPEVADASS